LKRLIGKTYPDTTTVNYTYDNDSRLTQVSDPTGTYQFTFDNMGRLTGTTTSYAFLGRNFTTGYGYDAASNRTSFTDPESGSTAYVYDTLNRVQTLTPPAAISGGSFGFGYDALSRRTSLTRPNTVNTNYSYDNLSRLLSVTHAKGGVTLDGATYTLDNAGNRSSKADLYASVTTNYGYDNIYELLSATQGASTTESYTYDPVGNRLSNLSGSGWSNNTSNELTSRPGVSYTYDNNGNTLTKTDSTGTTNYTWDFENRLTSVTLPGSGGTVSFKYDPFGRRIYKSSSGGASIFAYDGDNLIEETNAAGGVVARYLQTQKIDEPLAMLRGGTTSYYQVDGLGSVTSLSSPAGALAQTYTFDSFGNQTASTGSLTSPFRYTGRESDSETGMYYYRARYYDPTTGRFLTEDPLRFHAGSNFYIYTFNSPQSLIDPSGKVIEVSKVSGEAGYTNYLTAMLYLDGSPYAKAIIDDLQKSPNIYVLHVGDAVKEDEQDGNIVRWNPHKALCVQGGEQSPALNLLHELVHLWEQQNGLDAGNEEATTQITNPAARELGEPIRQNYGDGKDAPQPWPLPIPSRPPSARNK
jgi:RHS repeat-associated protein